MRRVVQLLVYFLAGNKDVIANVASRFNVSSRTIHRDVRLLRDAGCPIECVDIGEGFSLPQDSQLRCPQLTITELCSLIALSKLIQDKASEPTRSHLMSALEKALASSIFDFREKALKVTTAVNASISDFATLSTAIEAAIAAIGKPK